MKALLQFAINRQSCHSLNTSTIAIQLLYESCNSKGPI